MQERMMRRMTSVKAGFKLLCLHLHDEKRELPNIS